MVLFNHAALVWHVSRPLPPAKLDVLNKHCQANSSSRDGRVYFSISTASTYEAGAKLSGIKQLKMFLTSLGAKHFLRYGCEIWR